MKQSIQQYLGLPENWKIKENIKHEIILMPSRQDVSRAKQRDPKGCALRNTACRIFGVPNAAIGGRWAYIPQRDGKGGYYIARMQATKPTQRAIQEFDTKGTIPAAGFRFIPVSPYGKLEAKRLYMRKRYKKLLTKTGAPKSSPTPRRIKTRTIPMNVRVTA